MTTSQRTALFTGYKTFLASTVTLNSIFPSLDVVLAGSALRLHRSSTDEVCRPSTSFHSVGISESCTGLRVIATGVTGRRLESMAELAAQGIETLELDVTNDDSVQKAREVTAELTGGKLDILVNNAYVVLPVIAPKYVSDPVISGQCSLFCAFLY
jgi:hypothetical protein